MARIPIFARLRACFGPLLSAGWELDFHVVSPSRQHPRIRPVGRIRLESFYLAH